MSRNGPFGQARAPQRRHPAEQDPYATAPNGQWPQQNGGGYPDPHANGGAQGYGNGAGQQQSAPYQSQGGYHYPQTTEPEPQYYPQQQQGHDRYPAPLAGQTQPQAQWGPGQDQRNYDLGNYMPSGGGQQAFANAGQPQGFGPQTHEPTQHFQPQDAHFDTPPQGYAEGEGDYDEMLADGEDEPRSGRRWMLIAAALVGAIGLGGGLAYTYKMVFTSGSSRPPVVKAIDFPNKVKVTAKDTAGLDKKLPTRLGEDGPTPREPDALDDRSAESAGGGPRPVRIIPLTQGGGQQQGVSQGGTFNATGAAPQGGSGKQQVVVVPGLMIDTPGGGGGGSGQRVLLPQQQGGQGTNLRSGGGIPLGATGTTTTEQAVPQRKSPTTITATNPSVVKEAAAPAVKVPVPRKESVASAGGAAASAGGANGYVAVLSSQRSRLDAMKAYASMDQKYRDMLSSSTFDVQEADLGPEKGTWYRAVVGPPRSFDGAKKICEELKTAGYPSCWPAKY